MGIFMIRNSIYGWFRPVLQTWIVLDGSPNQATSKRLAIIFFPRISWCSDLRL